MNKVHKIELYTTKSCKYCNDAKDLFNENKLSFQEYNVYTDIVKRQEMVELTGQMGVPVIVVDGKFMVGFNKEELTKILGI